MKFPGSWLLSLRVAFGIASCWVVAGTGSARAAEVPDPVAFPSPVIGASSIGIRPRVYVAVYSHNEDPFHKETPRFEDPGSEATFWAFRDVTLEAAEWLHAHEVAYNLQCEWNFINGLKRYEIDGKGVNIKARAQALRKTRGKNLIRYLSEDLGIEIDTHTHENEDRDVSSIPYNYADVANLIEEVTGVTPSGIVGGQVISETSFANWPKFKDVLQGSLHPEKSWKFTAIMGESSANHELDIRGAGIWMPTEPGHPPNYDRYFEIDRTSSLLAIGSLEASAPQVQKLLRSVASGEIRRDRMLTAAFPFHASALVKGKYGLNKEKRVDGGVDDPTYVTDWLSSNLIPLIKLREKAQVEFVTFEKSLRIWKRRYGSEPYLCKQLGEGSTDCQIVD